MPCQFLQTQGGRATVAGAHCAGSLTVSPDCLPGTAPPGAAPLDAPPLPAPAPHAATHLPDAPAGTQQGPSRPAAAFWLTRGPPRGLVADRTNSWLYVPLLHAAAADLAPSALESWRADPRASVWWEQARQLLATSAPVAPQTLIAALARTAETAPENARHLPDLVARVHDAGLPHGSLVHAGCRMAISSRRYRKFSSNASVAMPSHQRSTVTRTASVQTPPPCLQLRWLTDPPPPNSPDRRLCRQPPPCMMNMMTDLPLVMSPERPCSATPTQLHQSRHQQRRIP